MSAGYCSLEAPTCSNGIVLELRRALDRSYLTSATVEFHTTFAGFKSTIEELTRIPTRYQKLLSETSAQEYLDGSAISETDLKNHSVVLFVELCPLSTALLDVCQGEVDDADLTRYVLSKGADLVLHVTMTDAPEEDNDSGDDDSHDEPQETRKSALDFAIQRGHTNVAKVLIENDLYTAINDVTDEGGALHTAANHGRVGICQALLDSERFTQANTLTSYGWSALHCAIPQSAPGEEEEFPAGMKPISIEDRCVVCRMLLEHSRFSAMNVRDTEGSGLSALDKAAYSGHANICALFLNSKRFTEVGTIDANKRTALHQLTAYPGKLPTECVVEVCQLLLADGRIDASARDSWGDTAFAELRKMGYEEACKLFPADAQESACPTDAL